MSTATCRGAAGVPLLWVFCPRHQVEPTRCDAKPAHLDSTLRDPSTKGLWFAKGLHEVLLHVFNHQTHHRGQATTLFSQAGIDVGGTDLLLLIPDISD